VLAESRREGKFDDIAQKRSAGRGHAAQGGDLDWNVPTNFDKAFADAKVKLDKAKG